MKALLTKKNVKVAAAVVVAVLVTLGQFGIVPPGVAQLVSAVASTFTAEVAP